MTRMLNDLSTLLEQELEACGRIRELALQERQAVVDIDPHKLDTINQNLQALLSHVGRMALQRLRIQEHVRQEMDLPDDTVRLTELVPHLPESHREALGEQAAQLKGLYGEISRGVATNQVLMNEYVKTTRSFFKEIAGGGEAPPTYSKRGTPAAPQNSHVSFEQTA